MSISQICDLAYVLQIEQLEERFKPIEQAFWNNRTEKDKNPPDFAELIEKFDKDLLEEFDVKEQSALQKFYGLR